MALQDSGQISLADIRSEFGGGSGQIALGDLYRGGSRIRTKAGNNSAVNLAASVPTSGEVEFGDYFSQAKAFRYTYTSGATNQDASNLFGSDYGVDYPKEIVINSGVELGATSTGQEALQINSGLSGSMTVTNNGTLSGAGGSANGGSGGDAFEANVSCTLINNGTIRAGGGGGGAGGGGGQGSSSYAYWGNSLGPYGWQGHAGAVKPPGTSSPQNYYVFTAGSSVQWYWNGSLVLNNYSFGTHTVGSYRYTSGGNWEAFSTYQWRYITREQYLTGTNYYNGGSGGSGGVGQGYNQSAGSGSGGSGGGTNAGSGGSGGGGGSFGNSGSTGNSGGNGNHSNGSGGSGGGSAGRYINGISNVSLTNNGTVQGGTA